jgi:uncharacterized membrane protein YtjA (UPF0391 family)
MKKHWLYYFSPCIIGIVISLIAVVAGFAGMDSSGGWSYVLVILFLPALIILVVADVLIKLLTKGKVLYIWILEAVVVAILIIWLEYYR